MPRSAAGEIGRTVHVSHRAAADLRIDPVVRDDGSGLDHGQAKREAAIPVSRAALPYVPRPRQFAARTKNQTPFPGGGGAVESAADGAPMRPATQAVVATLKFPWLDRRIESAPPATSNQTAPSGVVQDKRGAGAPCGLASTSPATEPGAADVPWHQDVRAVQVSGAPGEKVIQPMFSPHARPEK